MAPIQASFVAILMVLGAAVLRWLSPNSDGFFGWVGIIVDLISVGLVIGGVGWIVYNVVEWRTATFAVTNLRVMREEGLIKHRSSATMLSSLSDVRTDQSFIGKQLTFGDIVIYSQSGNAGVDRFRTIRAPMEFRNAIMAEKSATTHVATAPAAPTPAAAAAPAPTRPEVVTAPPSCDLLGGRGRGSRKPGHPARPAARSRPRSSKPRRRSCSRGCSTRRRP